MLPDPVIDLPAARPAVAPAGPSSLAARTKTLAVLSVVLVLCFGEPLYELARFSMHSSLYSHILLMPFISGYLIWLQRWELVRRCKPSPRWALVPLLLGLLIVATYWMGVHFRWQLQSADFLALMTSAFLLLFLSGWLASLGSENLRAMAFPLAMLVFMIPFPEVVRDRVEAFLQHGSAEAAYLLFKISGLPVLRDGTYFQLPGFSMQVAPECSGIRSSLVLFISALLGGYLLLRSNWSRAALVLAVIPLGLLRNAFRIFVLGQLCVQVDPDFINSDLHHRGGPLFFIVSLIPFFLLLFLLRKLERRSGSQDKT